LIARRALDILNYPELVSIVGGSVVRASTRGVSARTRIRGEGTVCFFFFLAPLSFSRG